MTTFARSDAPHHAFRPTHSLVRGTRPFPTFCACHCVMAAKVVAAIAQEAHNLDAIGVRCAAGTGGGSREPELAALLTRALEPA